MGREFRGGSNELDKVDAMSETWIDRNPFFLSSRWICGFVILSTNYLAQYSPPRKARMFSIPRSFAAWQYIIQWRVKEDVISDAYFECLVNHPLLHIRACQMH
jgi:hypothetical protein